MQLRDWDSLPLDLLSRVLSLLPLASLASAVSVCSHWHRAAEAADCVRNKGHSGPPWFLAMAARPYPAVPYHCYAFDPEQGCWHTLSLDFLPTDSRPLRLLTPASPFLLTRLPGTTLRLALCNPFTRQLHPLPELNVPRSNPAICVVADDSASSGRFRLYVAGGTSASTASYETTIEVYDYNPAKDKPTAGRWEVAGTMPLEFAVRLTVWTAGEGVHAIGGIYWITSARAYSVVRFDVVTGNWSQISAPAAERLEWASLVAVKGRRLGLVGGIDGEEEQGRVWEMVGDGKWRPVGVVPLVEKWQRAGQGGGTCRCVGNDGVVYLFKDLCSGMLVWREAASAATDDSDGDEVVRYAQWKWEWVDGWRPPQRKKTTRFPGLGDVVAIRAALVHPSLSPS